MKKVKILTITLMIVLITMVAFFGVYVQFQNRMENKVKDYMYSIDLKGARTLTLEVSDDIKTMVKDSEGRIIGNLDYLEEIRNLTEEEFEEAGYEKEEVKYNSEENKNSENYIKSKNRIEARLKQLGAENYTIKLDEQTGKIVIELIENMNTDYIISNILTVGEFKIVDSETREVLMDNSDIKLANVMYGTDTQGTVVYSNIEFTKEGKQKFEDISRKYITEEIPNEEITEETPDETITVEHKISMEMDDIEILSTSFEEVNTDGKMQLSTGSKTADLGVLQSNIEKASSRSIILDTGKMEIVYDLTQNEFIHSDITNNEMQIIKNIIIIIVMVALVMLIIKYKTFGLLVSLSYIGLASLLLLVIRYTNVILTIEGIVGIIMVLVLNYILVNKILYKLKESKEEVNSSNMRKVTIESYKEFFIRLIPIILVVITFCFAKWIPISSFGTVMFWGILLIAIYNIIVTNNILKVK